MSKETIEDGIKELAAVYYKKGSDKLVFRDSRVFDVSDEGFTKREKDYLRLCVNATEEWENETLEIIEEFEESEIRQARINEELILERGRAEEALEEAEDARSLSMAANSRLEREGLALSREMQKNSDLQREMAVMIEKQKSKINSQEKFILKSKEQDNIHFLRKNSMYFLAILLGVYFFKDVVLLIGMGFVESIFPGMDSKQIFVMLSNSISDVKDIAMIITGALITVFTQSAFNNKREGERAVQTINADGNIQTAMVAYKEEVSIGINPNPDPIPDDSGDDGDEDSNEESRKF